MKRLLLILSITLFSLTAFAQTQTKKWNQYLNRYEYYQGNTMVGVEVYNQYLQQWEYTSTNQPKVGTKQEWDVVDPYDIDMLGRMVQAKQAAYDKNYNAILQAITELNKEIRLVGNLNKAQSANIDRFYKWLNQVCQNDLSSNTLTVNIIHSISTKKDEVADWCEEGKIYDMTDDSQCICRNGKLVKYP